MKENKFTVLAGTYNKLFYGIKVIVSFKDGTIECDMNVDFVVVAHTQSLNSIIENGKYAISLSNDDSLRLYDIDGRLDKGIVITPDNKVTSIGFIDSYLVCSYSNGILEFFDTSKWEGLKSIKIFKKLHITSFVINQTSKYIICASKSKYIAVLDLMTMKTRRFNMEEVVAELKLSQSGNLLSVLYANNQIDIFNMMESPPQDTIKLVARPSAFRFFGDSHLLYSQKTEITVYNLGEKSFKTMKTFHKRRIKDFYIINCSGIDCLLTLASDGEIALSKFVLGDEIAPLKKISVDSMITCAAFVQ